MMDLSYIDIRATGRRVGDGILVLAGSEARAAELPSCRPQTQRLRAELLQNGSLVVGKNSLRFTVATKFTSLSSAACVITGANVNGLDMWRSDSGYTQATVEAAVARLRNQLHKRVKRGGTSPKISVLISDLQQLLSQFEDA
jgi:hypothetical protein